MTSVTLVIVNKPICDSCKCQCFYDTFDCCMEDNEYFSINERYYCGDCIFKCDGCDSVYIRHENEDKNECSFIQCIYCAEE